MVSMRKIIFQKSFWPTLILLIALAIRAWGPPIFKEFWGDFLITYVASLQLLRVREENPPAIYGLVALLWVGLIQGVVWSK